MKFSRAFQKCALGKKGYPTALVLVGLFCALAAPGSLEAGFVPPPPPISISRAEPLENGVLVFETVAPASSLHQPRYLVSLDLFLTNLGVVPHQLHRVSYQFLFRDSFSSPLHKDKALEILPGESKKLIMPFEGDLFAAPYRLNVELFFEGFGTPIQRSFEIEAYESPLPGGVIGLPNAPPRVRHHHYPFPARVDELEDGEYWATGQNHQLGSSHRKSSSQRFAYDFRVVGWNSAQGQWSAKRPGTSGDLNPDFRIWEKPVHAISNGEITYCRRDVMDNPSPPDQLPGVPGGGNAILVEQENGEIAFYAHLKEATIPEDICQVGTKIEEGDFLGLVGNSGSSTGPHLHLQISKGDGQGGRPLLFSGALAIHRELLDPADPDPPWAYVDNYAFGPGAAIFPGK